MFVLGLTHNKELIRLFLIQKEALLVMNFSDQQEPTSKLFSSQQIVKLHDLIELNKPIFIYDWNNGDLPSAIDKLFTTKMREKCAELWQRLSSST